MDFIDTKLQKNISVFGCDYVAKKACLHFLIAISGNSTHRRRKQMEYLESQGNSESETCEFYATIFLSKFDLM